jgi:hypothetical protein
MPSVALEGYNAPWKKVCLICLDLEQIRSDCRWFLLLRL